METINSEAGTTKPNNRDGSSHSSSTDGQAQHDEMDPGDIDGSSARQHIALKVCEIMERGDNNRDTSELYSILDIMPFSDASPPTFTKCRGLLNVFYTLIGRSESSSNSSSVDELQIPLSVKAHLLLRALLRIRCGKCLIAWEAANAAIQSFQYSDNKHPCTKNHPSQKSSMFSQGEGLAMIAEIRSFVIYLRTEPIDEMNLNQLVDLGSTILDPLRITMCNASEQNDGSQLEKTRRTNSCAVPLELISAILATLDYLDDTQGHLLMGNKDSSSDHVDDGTMITNCNATGVMQISARDKLLSYMFASYSIAKDTTTNSPDCKVNSFRRTMRADAALPLLSLAMDDIGFSRMSTSLDGNEDVTYWDCLEFALHNVVGANLVCYKDFTHKVMAEEAKQHILDEALADDGVHIIPSSDYPALMRCMFRMVATTSSSGISPSQLRWESLLLQLYHAAVVATTQTLSPSIQCQKTPGRGDRLSALSTVESHVLLPSFTGASVSTIMSILEACYRECCQSCKEDASSESLEVDPYVVPTWAAAGVVLLLMRARSSNLSHSATSASFGPRVVFRMASDMLQRKSACQYKTDDKSSSIRSGGGDDDVGYALKVLLHLSGVKDGTCRLCRDVRLKQDTEASAAYDVLKYSYYGNERFSHRYSDTGVGRANNLYRHQLGLDTLSSYCKLVRTSLNHGAFQNTAQNQSTDPFIADTARTWIDAANMLLDESYCSSSSGKESSTAPDATALAIIIIVVIFLEVPSSQHDVVRFIYDRLANVTSHHSQTTGRQRKESCFVLISMLAWSLVASEEEHSSINVVRRKSGKSKIEHVTSVLGPLCNLLSKSALSRDESMLTSSSKGTPNLSYWSLRQLAHALAPCPSGREVILAMAQKNMAMLFTSLPYSHRSSSKNVSFHESFPSNASANTDAIYLAIDCMCLLIEKCNPLNNSSEDDCGRRALGMITDIIVLQGSSHLSINVLSWMFCKLNTSTCLGKFTKWTSQRLLRACFAGLSDFIALDEYEPMKYSSVLLPAAIFSSYTSSVTIHKDTSGKMKGYQAVEFRARNDVPGMLRLAFCLYDELGKPHENMPTLLKSHLLYAIHSQHEKPYALAAEDASDQHRIDQLFKEGHYALQKGFDPSDESIGYAIDIMIVMILSQGAARMIHKNNRGFSERVDTDTLKNLSDYLYHAERYNYLEEDHPNSPIPNWIEVQNQRSIVHVDEALQNCMDFKVFHMSVCDILVEILLQHWTLHGEGDLGNHDNGLHVLVGVNSILGCKRQVHQSMKLPSSSEIFLVGMSHSSICSLFELSSQHLCSLLRTSESKKDSLPELDMLIKNVLDLCTLPPTSSRSRNLSSFWSFYCSLADEESSQLLLLLVKESYLEMGKWADPGTICDISISSFSLMKICSSEDLDYHIRYLRGVILSALSQLLTSIITSKSLSSAEEQKSSLGLLLQILPQICQDLDAAFQGYSGGIDKTLFLIFLDAIDKCIDAIWALFESLPTSSQCESKSSFESAYQAAAIIWNVFCENPLRQASIVKGTLRLCIDKIPNIIQRVERVINECVLNKSPWEHTFDLLDQCGSYLMSKPIQKETQEKTHKSERATDNIIQVKSVNEVNISLLESMKKAEEIPTENSHEAMVAEEKIKQSLGRETRQMPNIERIEALTWVYTCALVAVTNIWNTSYRVIADCGELKMPQVQSSTANISVLVLRRIKGFSRLHTLMCRLFEEKVAPKEEETKDLKVDSNESITTLVELLSYHGKSNMCYCVERTTMTLILAFKQLIRHFKETPFNEGKLGESTICIIGWLQSIRLKEMKNNLITGTLQWYINEKRNLNLSSFGKSGNSGYPVLSRLPKMILRLEGLNIELRKLDAILIDFSMGNSDCSKGTVLVLNKIASALMKEKVEVNVQDTFSGLVRQCIKIIDSSKNEVMKMNEIDDSLLSDEDEWSEGDNFTASGKRKKQHYAPMRRSRMTSLRSRNDTIDNWLTIDDDEFGSAPGERYNVGDAFVDLEDFLVEG